MNGANTGRWTTRGLMMSEWKTGDWLLSAGLVLAACAIGVLGVLPILSVFILMTAGVFFAGEEVQDKDKESFHQTSGVIFIATSIGLMLSVWLYGLPWGSDV